MLRKYIVLGMTVDLIAFMIAASTRSPNAAQSDKPAGIPPEIVADYIHAVMEAHRTIYTTHVVDRMQQTGKVAIAEDWKQKEGLPLPAQFLLYTGRLVAEKGGGSPCSPRQPMADLRAEWPGHAV